MDNATAMRIGAFTFQFFLVKKNKNSGKVVPVHADRKSIFPKVLPAPPAPGSEMRFQICKAPKKVTVKIGSKNSVRRVFTFSIPMFV